MVWYVVVAVVAFVAGIVVGAWLMQRRIAQAAAQSKPVRLPSQSEFLANADGPVGPDHPRTTDQGLVPGPAQDRDQPPT